MPSNRMPAKLISKPPLPCRNARAHPFPLSPLLIRALTAEDAEDAEEIASPPALSSKLEREPKSYAIVHQRGSITLSTRMWGERAGVRGVSFASFAASAYRALFLPAGARSQHALDQLLRHAEIVLRIEQPIQFGRRKMRGEFRVLLQHFA